MRDDTRPVSARAARSGRLCAATFAAAIITPATFAAATITAAMTTAAWPASAAGSPAKMPPSTVLSCADLAPLLEQREDRVIEAEGAVSASGAQAVPPYLVLCAGTPRIACIMETPLTGADVGRPVHVMGRLSGGDRRMLVIDPCGATLAR